VEGGTLLVMLMTHWYSSATFWTGAGTIVAAVAIVVTVILWFIGSPHQRLLVYSVSETPLLTGDTLKHVDQELKITLNDQLLTDPHMISLFIESRSRRDIRTVDFEDGRPLALDLGTTILKMLHHETGEAAMPKVQVGIDGSSITIGPGLINRRQVIKVDVLTDAPIEVTCPDPSLADVTIRDGHEFLVQPMWSVWIGRLVAICFISAIAAQAFSGHWIDHLSQAASIFVLIGVGLMFISLILMIFTSTIVEGGFFWQGTYGRSGRRTKKPPNGFNV
jgi:hypothetical protein